MSPLQKLEEADTRLEICLESQISEESSQGGDCSFELGTSPATTHETPTITCKNGQIKGRSSEANVCPPDQN